MSIATEISGETKGVSLTRHYDVLYSVSNTGVPTGSLYYLTSGRINVRPYSIKGFLGYTTGSSLDVALYGWYDTTSVYPTGSVILSSGSATQNSLVSSFTTDPYWYIEAQFINTGSNSYSGSKISLMVVGQG